MTTNGSARDGTFYLMLGARVFQALSASVTMATIATSFKLVKDTSDGRGERSYRLGAHHASLTLLVSFIGFIFTSMLAILWWRQSKAALLKRENLIFFDCFLIVLALGAGMASVLSNYVTECSQSFKAWIDCDLLFTSVTFTFLFVCALLVSFVLNVKESCAPKKSNLNQENKGNGLAGSGHANYDEYI